MARKLLNEVNNDPGLPETVITGDKICVYHYDVNQGPMVPIEAAERTKI